MPHYPDKRYVQGDLAGQAAHFGTWNSGMQIVGAGLGFATGELDRIKDDNTFIQWLLTTKNAVDAFDGAVRNNRRIMLTDDDGAPTPDLPVSFGGVTLPTTGSPVEPGIWDRHNKDIARVRKQPTYTDETGAFLDILPTIPTAPDAGSTSCALKVSVSPGYHVKVDGIMMGMDAIRVDYQRIGSTAWPLAAFLTKLPGEFVITPQTPGEPESGRIRGVYIKDSQEFGQFSPEYPITTS